MVSKSAKIRDEIKYYEREKNDWSLDSSMFNAKEKIQELDDKIKELKEELYEAEYEELVEEENKHNNING